MDDLSLRLRDELRRTQSGHNPWFGIRLMRHYEDREFAEDGQPPKEGPAGSGTRSPSNPSGTGDAGGKR
ncbi:hypothetical protein SPF06_18905 [Sinomonas sp. JGH33]|uniref:Uncharacterized protein n=1 Tax=Sinomonas terricola TaxID=3110330 RepID=A0ABU5TAU2_9MICC|nr:hypothetical protein [Sinomonas sp. JGH33]MEA5456798.1 hypothetical protein [Sinomonas sp. JGH33]